MGPNEIVISLTYTSCSHTCSLLFGTDPIKPEPLSIPSDAVSGECLTILAAMYGVVSVSELTIIYNHMLVQVLCMCFCVMYVYV